METTEINGIPVIHEFKVYHHEWECDGFGWVTKDGKIWMTGHGHLRECDAEDIIEKMEELYDAIKNMRKAIDLYATRINGTPMPINKPLTTTDVENIIIKILLKEKKPIRLDKLGKVVRKNSNQYVPKTLIYQAIYRLSESGQIIQELRASWWSVIPKLYYSI